MVTAHGKDSHKWGPQMKSYQIHGHEAGQSPHRTTAATEIRDSEVTGFEVVHKRCYRDGFETMNRGCQEGKSWQVRGIPSRETNKWQETEA